MISDHQNFPVELQSLKLLVSLKVSFRKEQVSILKTKKRERIRSENLTDSFYTSCNHAEKYSSLDVSRWNNSLTTGDNPRLHPRSHLRTIPLNLALLF